MSLSLRRAPGLPAWRKLIATFAVAGTALAASALAGPARAAAPTRSGVADNGVIHSDGILADNGVINTDGIQGSG